MLFNSPEFLLLFLPVTLLGFVLLRARSPNLAMYWLLVASLAFYASWEPQLLVLLVGSMVLNFLVGPRVEQRGIAGRRWLVAGVAANLAVLGWFKYAVFVLGSFNAVAGTTLPLPQVVLPIAISFFTFQQIAYLVDVHRGADSEPSMARYMLFVSVFPHLIAGPLTHHREMIPQFGRRSPDPWADMAEGLTLFTIGLLKKLLVADTVARPSDAVFDAAALGLAPTFVDAWMAALCYTVQIYFDFSGYSDMALGLGRMFGLRLPINFASPYRATSIIDFWRRWHITLSRFLRDYLYVPLGGNRRGPGRQKINLLVTMLLGGLWHGANWTFVVWGGLHGLFLLLNHGWRALPLSRCLAGVAGWRVFSAIFTMLCVVLTWVPFRAVDMVAAMSVWRGMAGLNGIVVPVQLAKLAPAALPVGQVAGFSVFVTAFALLALIAAMILPNAYQFMGNARPGLPSAGYPETRIAPGTAALWRPNLLFAVLVGLGLAVALLKLNDISAFIYSYTLTVLGTLTVAWLAAAILVFGTRAVGRPSLPAQVLLDNRAAKVAQPAAQTIFVGDSSLGNAIDAAVWQQLSGRSASNLALTGFYGYGGSYNMIQRSLANGRPRNVIVMQTVDMLSRPLSERAYDLTRDPAQVGLLPRLRLAVSQSVNLDELGESVGWLRAGRPNVRSPLDGDYIKQGPALVPPAQVAGFSVRTIQPAKRKYLNEIAGLCSREGLNCLYVHGPLASPWCEHSRDYMQAVARLINQPGLRLVSPDAFCMPAGEIGDSTDHVAPAHKAAYTRRYYALLQPYLVR